MKLCIGLLGMHDLVGRDFAAVHEMVAMADKKGIDQLSVTDHVVMGTGLEAYPYGDFAGSPRTQFLDPLVYLGSFASVTSRIRLSSGIVVAPLRPAPVLAKQIATLDVLSRGRVTIGLGVGWQREEYDACGVSWDSRFAILEEQIRACKALWSGETVSFHGEHVHFDNLTARPAPVQGASLPILLGVALLKRNVERIAELCNGWTPMERDPAVLRTEIDKLKRAFEARGRDPETLEVRTTYEVIKGADGKPDLAATLAQTADYAAAGVTMVRLEPRVFCRGPEDYETFLDRAIEARDSVTK